jgi:hypothetical protein
MIWGGLYHMWKTSDAYRFSVKRPERKRLLGRLYE